MLDKDQILSSLFDHRQNLRQIGVQSIGLFGSTARGEASEDSDLDFVVELFPKTFDAYMDVKEYLERLFLRKIDLGLADSIKAALKARIQKDLLHIREF